MAISRRDLLLRAGDREVPAYLARPAGDARAPGVVVLHEVWGVERHIRSVADRLAEAGYAAIAPNLLGMDVTLTPAQFFAGYQALQAVPPEERAVPERIDAAIEVVEPEVRAQLKRLLGVVGRGATPEALAGVRASVEALQAQGAPKVAVMGFCLGGGFTWAYAGAGGEADAFAPFYGRLPADFDATQVKAPLEGHYGAEDHGIPVAPLEAAAARLRAAGQDATVFVYEGAPHAFFNDTRDTYHPEAAQLAWQRLLAFFGRTLKAKEVNR